MDIVRITELQPKTYVEQGDYIAIDNQSDGTKKVQFTNLLDDTLSQENKIAPANVVGDEIATIRAAVGSPLKASTVAQMTDTNKIYVYVGSEYGYINGNWYYWNGSAWVSGGVYNSVAVVTDPTLTLSGVPADAKATGDEVTNLKSEINYIADVDVSNIHIHWVAGAITSSGADDDTKTATHSRTQDYYKESELYKLLNPNLCEIYGYKYTYSNGVHTFVSALALNLTTAYTFDPESEYYWRIAGRVKIADVATSGIELQYYTKIVTDIKELQAEVGGFDERIDALEADNQVISMQDIYDASTFTNEYLKWADGTTVSHNDSRTSPFIEVSEGQIINYSLTAMGTTSPVIACYDSSKAYQQSASIKALGNGSWNLNTGSLTVPSGIKYIRYSSCRTTTTTDSISIDTVETLKEYVLDNIGNQWNGKKWAAFGTSITDTSYTDVHFLQPTGKYVPFLKDMSGMVVTNYGMAGAPILNNIMNKVLTTNLSAFDIVTIEGSVNDHAMSKPLGQVGDVGTDTFAGAIYQMAKYVYENSNATLFFITDYVGRYVHINPAPDGSDFYGDCAPTKVNNDGLLQIDYINMMIKQCEYFGIPCITAGQDAGINLITGSLYLMDHIHSSYVGGKQYAETIWKELKQYQPRVLTV